MKRIYLLSLGAMTAGLLLSTVTTIAQPAGGGRGGNFDPEEMRARMAERMKEQLKASDDEWKVIQPLLQDVQEKQQASMGGRFGGMRMMFSGGPGGQGGPPDVQRGDNQRPRRGLAENRRGGGGSDEVAALSAALENEDTPAADIKAKLQAVRESRKKAEAELKTAREKLREVLTARQEAQLVLMGMLD